MRTSLKPSDNIAVPTAAAAIGYRVGYYKYSIEEK
jgi:hypothetical protein